MNRREERELFEYLARISNMGEIRAVVELENALDASLELEGKLDKKLARRLRVDAVVDTGAVMVLLPQDIVEKLGLRAREKRIVVLANDQKIELDVAGGFTLRIGDRSTNMDCLVGPPGCEPLIGQLVMEALDLIADPVRRTLTPRPESPFLPTLKMKGARQQTAYGSVPLSGVRGHAR